MKAEESLYRASMGKPATATVCLLAAMRPAAAKEAAAARILSQSWARAKNIARGFGDGETKSVAENNLGCREIITTRWLMRAWGRCRVFIGEKNHLKKSQNFMI